MLLQLIHLALLAGQLATGHPAGKTEEVCRDIVGGTGGRHLIRTTCPERERAVDEAIRESLLRSERNRRIVGRQCSSGAAYLRSGGNVDNLADYVCTCPEEPAADTKAAVPSASNR